MASQALNIFERNALFQQIGDCGDAEGVRRESRRETGVMERRPHKAADIQARDRFLTGSEQIVFLGRMVDD